MSRSSSCSSQQKSSDPRTRTLEEGRDRLDGLAWIFPLPGDVACSELELGGVPTVRLAAPEPGDNVLFCLYGGGYGGGSPLSHSELAARLARAAGAVAVPDHTGGGSLNCAYREIFRDLRFDLKSMGIR